MRKVNLFKHVLKRQISWRICRKNNKTTSRKGNWVWKECHQQTCQDKERQNKFVKVRMKILKVDWVKETWNVIRGEGSMRQDYWDRRS